MKRITAINRLPLLLVCLIFAGCAPASFQKPLEKYQQSVAKSTALIAAYYKDINQAERDSYLRKRLYDPTLIVKMAEAVETRPGTGKRSQSTIQIVDLASGSPASGCDGPGATEKTTPLVCSFYSQESIKARLDLLDSLALLGQRLAELAGSKAPAETAAAFDQLGKNFFSLSSAFSKLPRGNPETVDPKEYAAYTSVIAKALEGALSAARDKMVADFIKSVNGDVNTAFDKLKEDLDNLGIRYERLNRQALANALAHYSNADRSDFNRRKVYLEQINILAIKLEDSRLNRPADLVAPMRKAWNGLHEYACSYHKVDDFHKMVSVVNTSAQIVDQFSSAIMKIRTLQSANKL